MVTVIITIWKRTNAKEQIKALLNQTIPPTKIFIYHCCEYQMVDMSLMKMSPIIEYQFNTNNLGYFGRFSLALSTTTKYLYILDDDVIPSLNWIQTCMSLCEELNSVISSAGRLIPVNNFYPEVVQNKSHLIQYFIGDDDDGSTTNKCLKNTYVDYGCNSWFIKTEWLNFFWAYTPYTYNTGEDIHLSATCLLKGGIKTVVPYQDGELTCGNLKKKYGWDQFASWKKPDFYELRRGIFEYWILGNFWSPIYWVT